MKPILLISRLLLLLPTFLLLSATPHRGSGTAFLSCKSVSGKTVFNAELQDIIGLLESAEFSIDGKKILFTSDDEVYTIFDAKNGVFTIYITGKTNDEFPNSRYIRLWAIPSSFKTILRTSETQHYEFKAKIMGTEPRKGNNFALLTPTIELNCTLKYTI